MIRPTVIDSDVLIDYLREWPPAIAFVESRAGGLLMSAVTLAELYSNVREGRERAELEELAEIFYIVDVDEEIAVEAGLLRRAFLKSHRLAVADAIIAATAVVGGADLATLNRKHFPMFPGLTSPYTKP